MKKAVNFFGLTLFLTFLFTAFDLSAADKCDKAVDCICHAFDNMTAQVKSVRTMQELEAMDFDNIDLGPEAENVPDSCLKATLTTGQKERINTSIDKFIDSLIDVTYKIARSEYGDILSRSDIANEMEPLKASFKSLVNSSKTLEELIDKMMAL